jgi:hypothetical protein
MRLHFLRWHHPPDCELKTGPKQGLPDVLPAYERWSSAGTTINAAPMRAITALASAQRERGLPSANASPETINVTIQAYIATTKPWPLGTKWK